MPRIALIARGDNAWAASLLTTLRQLRSSYEWSLAGTEGLRRGAAAGADPLESQINDGYVPSFSDRDAMMPDLAEAERVFEQSSTVQPRKFILLSSALVYGTSPARQGLVNEDYPGHGGREIRSRWKALEESATRCFNGRAPLTILRPTTVMGSPALLSRRLMRKIVVTLP